MPAEVVRARTDGRTRPRDIEQTRADIIEAATAEFADKGLSGARVDEIAARTRTKRLLHRLNVTEYVVADAARAILAELLPHAGENIWVEPPFHCDYGSNIHCGDNVYFNVNCVVLDCARVSIGSNVLFGPGVQLYAATHPLDAVVRRTLEYAKPITIGDDCWFGGGAIVCPGITSARGP